MTQTLTIEEVAERTRIPVATLRQYRAQGAGPHAAKIGRRLFYRAADVDAWLDAQFGDGPTPAEIRDQLAALAEAEPLTDIAAHGTRRDLTEAVLKRVQLRLQDQHLPARDLLALTSLTRELLAELQALPAPSPDEDGGADD